MSQPILSEDRFKCANPDCEADASRRRGRCNDCGESFFHCSSCGATARTLARFCRSCRAELNADWATEHSGLKRRISRTNKIAESKSDLSLSPDWQISFGVEMLASPLAARGIAIFPLSDGRILIADECDGTIRAELKTGSPISFTPAIIDNLLIAATESAVIAFDLIAALYGGMAEGDLTAWKLELSAGEQIVRPLLAEANVVIASVKQQAGLSLLFIDKKTGSRRSEIAMESRSSKATAPYLAGKNLFTASKDGTIMLFDVESERLAACVKLGCETDVNTLPCGRSSNAFFVAADGQLWNAVVKEGSLQIQPFGDTRGLIVNAFAASEKYVAAAHGSGFALFDQYGAQLWETALDANSIITVPLIEGDLAWVIDDSGTLFFFNLTSSTPRLRRRIFEHSPALPMILTNDRLIAAARSGEVKTFLLN